MDKWRGRYLMTAGVVLQIFGAIGFTVAPDSEGVSLLLAVPLAIGGLLLYGRGARDTVQRESEPPVNKPAPGSRLEEMILTLQEDVSRLREDREFYRELYVDHSGAELGASALPSGRDRELTYRLVPQRSGPPRPPTPR